MVIADVAVAYDLARTLHKNGNLGESVIIAIDKDEGSTIGGYQKHCIKYYEAVEMEKHDEACRSLLILTPAPTPKNDTFTAIVANYSAKEPFFVPEIPGGLKWEVPSNAANAYDAVQVLAGAITRAYNKSSDGNVTGNSIMREVLNHKYKSILGFDQQIDENGDAEGSYTLLSFAEGRGMFKVASFISEDCPNWTHCLPKFQYLPGQKIEWPDSIVPPDEPPCGFDYEYCEELFNWKQIILVTCCFALTSIALAFIVK